jgi:GNAT superfamily N-acetyltransferase
VPAHADLVRRIEHASVRAWPPRRTASVQGWLLRAAAGHTRRANSVQALDFESDGYLGRAIDAVEHWYGGNGLPACFQLTDAARPPGIDGALASRGYETLSPSSVMLAPAEALADAPRDVELLHRPAQAVANALADPLWPAATRRERALLLGRIRRPHRYALAAVGGEPAAAGLCVLDDDLAGIFAMRTQAPFRRRGLATGVLAALAGWARAAGARQIYLQVEDENEAARQLYERRGFVRVYGYRYRERRA